MPEPLPSFKHPPVVETVLGVQFDPVQSFSIAHLGAFWKRLGPEWRHLRDAPPLPQEKEYFGEQRAWPRLAELSLNLSSRPIARVMIRNADQTRMVQFQNGRLHYNWIGHSGNEYARYDGIRPEFLKVYSELNRFFADENLPEIRLNQWEVTYVNHIPRGSVWQTPEDWQKLFTSFVIPRAATEDIQAESFGGEWHYEIVPQRGRLHVQLQHGRQNAPSGKEILILKLTARGPVPEGSGVEVGLDLGRDIIVKSFARLTSREARQFWEQVQ